VRGLSFKAVLFLLFFGMFTLFASCSTREQITPRDEAHPTLHPEHEGQEQCELCRTYRRTKRGVVKLKTENRVGTGIIVSTEGRFLTAAHVIGNADSVTVKSYDGRTGKALLINKSRRFNMALLEMEDPPEDLHSMNLMREKRIRKGQRVTVIGHPLNLEWSITQGIVSGLRKNREVIQTDAGVNPGNSGGPMLNRDGKIIGMLIAKMGGEQADNIAFARPSWVMYQFLKKTRKKGLEGDERTDEKEQKKTYTSDKANNEASSEN